MATISFENLKQYFAMNSVSVSVKDTYTLHKTDIGWATSGGHFIRATGTDFSQDLHSGTVNTVTFDLGNNNSAAPDITVKGLSADFEDFMKVRWLSGGSDEDRTNWMWSAILAGDDTLKLGDTGKEIVVYGDGVTIDSVVRSGDDIFTGAVGDGTAIGDFALVRQKGYLSAGDDKMTVSGDSAYGDVLYAYGYVGAGDDVISPYAGKALGSIFGDSFGVYSGGVMTGGNDIMTLSATSKAYGDCRFADETGRLIGGNDKITGGTGANTIYGDVYSIGEKSSVVCGNDTIHGGDGNDIISGDWWLNYIGDGVKGGRDNLYGDAGNDTIYGNNGNDYIDGGSGADEMHGGLGDDTYRVQNAGDVVDEVTIAGGTNDTVLAYVSFSTNKGVENVTLLGDKAINATCNFGDNRIQGNIAHNVLTGGFGFDTFIFKTALTKSNFDTIADFSHVRDNFEIDNAVFNGLSSGGLSSSDFKEIASSGVDTSDRILYDKAHGDIYFDRDGSATKYGRVRFAEIEDNTTLDNTDFLVI